MSRSCAHRAHCAPLFNSFLANLPEVRDTFENSLKLMGFLGVVYSISPFLFLVMAGYAFFGAFATVTIFGGPLVQLDRNIRSQEVGDNRRDGES